MRWLSGVLLASMVGVAGAVPAWGRSVAVAAVVAVVAAVVVHPLVGLGMKGRALAQTSMTADAA